jgi:hypothetical protein
MEADRMSWVTDLAAALGLPGGATIVAVAMLLGFNAAEKWARPEALRDVARLLKLTSSERSAEPVNAILRIFNLIFGEQHFSSRCAGRSFLATLTVIFAANLVVYLEVYERRPDWTIHRFGHLIRSAQSADLADVDV